MAPPSTTPETLLQEAETLVETGNPDMARRLLGEALRLAPESVRGWNLAARLAPSFKEEAYCLKRVLQLDPGQAWAGRRLRELGQLQTVPLDVPSDRSAVREDALTSSLATTAPAAILPAEALASSAEPAIVSLPAAAPPPKPLKPAKASRQRRTDPVFVFLCVMVALFSVVFCLTMMALISRLSSREALPTAIVPMLSGTLAAETPSDLTEDCQALIARALQVAESNCSQLAPNQACYGNTQLSAQLVPGATHRFQARGDIIGVDQLLRISASPLDLTTKDWGVAIFKLLANVPRSLPGQNVTFIVFGNTSFDKASGDLRAFYFSSQLGQIACARLPSDGILIHMPDGAGLTFSANGAVITLLGTAELKARPNENMTVSVASGIASVTAAGQTQYFGAGQEVRMPLGGAGGLEPAGPPLPPSDIAGGLPATCAMLGVNCKPGDVPRIDPTQAAIAIAHAMASSTAGPSGTPRATSTRSVTPGPLTATVMRTPTGGATPSRTPSVSVTPGPVLASFTPSRTWTLVPTAIPSPSPSNTQPPVPTLTPTSTDIPTLSPTSTSTDVPVCQLSAGGLAVSDTHLTLRIGNGGASPAVIVSMTLDWPDTPPAQKIREIRLSGTVIDTNNYNNPPSSIPLSGIWIAGQPADRQLPAHSDKDLEFVFQEVLPATGYNLAINFDNGCSVSASR